jgi:hypothetical protein
MPMSSATRPGGEGRGIDRLLAEEELACRIDGHRDELRRVGGLCGVGLRQVELQARGHQRRGDHEDDQQHQHDVDQRRHVDVTHRLRAGGALQASEGHRAQARPAAGAAASAIISRRSCAKP